MFTEITFAQQIDIEKYRASSEKSWATAMAEFAKRNQTEQHPDDAILFIGSSSIRFWKDIGNDMQPYHAIQRGFGGCNWADIAVHADQIIKPHQFQAIVFFAANDIVGKKQDKTADEVSKLFQYVVKKVRAHHPSAPIFYIAVTPTSSRFAVWPQTRAANFAARDYCNKTENVYFIGTESIYLNADRKPRDELFLKDKLHQNRAGYILWTAAIKAHLDAVLNEPNWTSQQRICLQPSAFWTESLAYLVAQSVGLGDIH